MTRNSLLSWFIVLVSVTFLAFPRYAQAQNGPAPLLTIDAELQANDAPQVTYSAIDATKGWSPPVVTGSDGVSASVSVSVVTPGQHWRIVQTLGKTGSLTGTFDFCHVDFAGRPGTQVSVITTISSLSDDGTDQDFVMNIVNGPTGGKNFQRYQACQEIQAGCTGPGCNTAQSCRFSSSDSLSETLGSTALPMQSNESSPGGSLDVTADGDHYTEVMTTDVTLSGAAPLVTLLDPIPSLVAGFPYALSQDPNVLGNDGRVIEATSADGVAKVVIRISGLSADQAITLKLLDDNGALADVTQDGGLGEPSDVSFTENMLNLSAKPVGNDHMAFAVYSPPPDFARAGVQADQSLVSRLVTLKSQDSKGNQLTLTNVQILRPPVLYIHGIWDSAATWNDFSTGLLARLPGEFSCRVDYAQTHGDSVNFNTRFALLGAKSCLREFRTMNHASAAQLDFIVHSMGGLISNNMPQFSAFQSTESYGQGYIHKLITVDTPYFGSPFAANLSQSSPICKAIFNNLDHKVGGAVEDLIPRGPFLQSLKLSSLYYKRAISGELNPTDSQQASKIVNDVFAALSFKVPPILQPCRSIFVTPLTAPPSFTFNNYFGDVNDLVVGKTSELGLLQSFSDITPRSVAHLHLAIPYVSQGFVGALDQASDNPAIAVTLLNSPISSGKFLH